MKNLFVGVMQMYFLIFSSLLHLCNGLRLSTFLIPLDRVLDHGIGPFVGVILGLALGNTKSKATEVL